MHRSSHENNTDGYLITGATICEIATEKLCGEWLAGSLLVPEWGISFSLSFPPYFFSSVFAFSLLFVPLFSSFFHSPGLYRETTRVRFNYTGIRTTLSSNPRNPTELLVIVSCACFS